MARIILTWLFLLIAYAVILIMANKVIMHLDLQSPMNFIVKFTVYLIFTPIIYKSLIFKYRWTRRISGTDNLNTKKSKQITK